MNVNESENNYFTVMCISKHKWYDVTIGQTYNVTEYEPMNPDKPTKLYRTDNNKYYPIELFIKIEQYREQQLNKILE